MPTKIIRPLLTTERLVLQEELSKNKFNWAKHDNSEVSTTVLEDGRSIHINFVSNSLKFMYSNFDLFPKTYEILKEFSDSRVIGRCYWHRLMPGDTINRHTDNGLWFVENNKLHARYQIYLDCPSNSVVIDGVHCNAQHYEYSVVDFDLRMPHSYNNEGSKPWYFLVFDVLKDGVNLK